MNLQNIAYLLQVSKDGSINKAAHNLFISQPYLSNIVKETEDEIGIKIFDRSNNGVKITPQGLDFLMQAKNILNDFNNLKSLYYANRAEKMTSFKLSITKSSHIMEVFIKLCKDIETEGKIRLYINEGNTDEVIKDVCENAYDLGVIFFNSIQKKLMMNILSQKNLEYRNFIKAKPHILISKNHPLIKGNMPINFETISDYGFVRYIDSYENFMHYMASEESLFDLDNMEKVVYVFGRSSLMHMISQSDFFAIGIESFKSQEQLYNVVSIPMEESPVSIEFGYIYKKNTNLTELSKHFISLLENEFKK